MQSARCRSALAGSPAGSLPDSVYYAWLSQGLPSDAPALLALPRAKLAQALERAYDTHAVSPPAEDALLPLRQSYRALQESSSMAAAHDASDLAWPELAMGLVHQSLVAAQLAPAPTGRRLTVADLFGDPPWAWRSH